MRYTEYGLQITLEELRNMLEYAENRAKYGNIESSRRNCRAAIPPSEREVIRNVFNYGL